MRNIKAIKAMRLSLLVAMLSIGLNVTAQTQEFSKGMNSKAEGDFNEMTHLLTNKKGVLFTIEGDTMTLKNQPLKILSSNTFDNDDKNVTSVYRLSNDELGRMTKVTVSQYGTYYRVSIIQRDVDFNTNYYVSMYAVKKTK